MSPIEKLLAAAARLVQHGEAARDEQTRIIAKESAAAIRGAVVSLQRAAESTAARNAKAAAK
jgi:hypothetical protein